MAQAKSRSSLLSDVATTLASAQAGGIKAVAHRSLLTSILTSTAWDVRSISGTSATLVEDDASKVLRFTGGSPATLYLPHSSDSPSLNFPAPAVLLIEALQAPVTISDLNVSPTLVRSADGLKIPSGRAALLVHSAANEFQLYHFGASTFTMTVFVGDETTPITTGTAKLTFRMPVAVDLLASHGVRASLATANNSGSPTSGPLTVDVNRNGATILSTKITIDNDEKTSLTAATPPVLSVTSLARDDEITIDVDTPATSEAAGLKVTFVGTYA